MGDGAADRPGYQGADAEGGAETVEASGRSR